MRITLDRSISLGAVLSALLTSASVIISVVGAYHAINNRMIEIQRGYKELVAASYVIWQDVQDLKKRTQRMELYLQGRDEKYWDKIKRYESAMPKSITTPTPTPTPTPPVEQWGYPVPKNGNGK